MECKRYHGRLTKLVATKKGESYATNISWVRARVSFALLRSALLCLEGSRASRRVRLELPDIDRDIEREHANIRYGNYSKCKLSLFDKASIAND